jgi:diguanylate cyclase (GGDEF)-like protein
VLSLGIDVTESKRMEQELQALATTDPLTGLSNRRQFLARLTEEFGRVQRFGRTSSVLMLDLDRFKRINDTYGHAAGDAALKHFAALIVNALRKIDTAGRLGGEEFAIILPGADATAARISAERLCEIVAKTPFMYGGNVIPLAVSIGIASTDAHDSAPDVVLARADKALYRAKGNGRNRVELAKGDIALHAKVHNA